jgi:purine-binding chemotaxis protein CheW
MATTRAAIRPGPRAPFPLQGAPPPICAITATENRNVAQAAATAAQGAREYLSFKLGAEEYGIDILKVQEIRGYENPTRVGGAPPHIKGLINLRGIIVPIVDLRMRFGLAEVVYDASTVVIILDVGGRVLGFVVDSVCDVTALTPAQIKPAPGFDERADSDFIFGLGSTDERMLILMDVERLIGGAEMGLTNEQAH